MGFVGEINLELDPTGPIECDRIERGERGQEGGSGRGGDRAVRRWEAWGGVGPTQRQGRSSEQRPHKTWA